MRPECQQCQEWMEEAFGGELKPERQPALDSHLAGCEDCRAAWEDFRLLRRGLDVLAEEADGPSPFIEAKILRAAAGRKAAKEAPSAFWRWLLRPATIGFATLALIAGIGYLGREELLQRRQASDLTAPVPPPAKPQAIPAQPSSDTLGGSKPKTTVPVERAKRQAEKPTPSLDRPELQQQAPIPAPAEEKGRATTAPSAPAAPAAPAPSGAAMKGEGRGREASIPEAEFAAPAPPEKDAKKKIEETKPAEPAANKSLQKPAAAQPGGALDKSDDGAIGTGLAQTELREDGRFERLLQGAKAKIKGREYASALDDLLAAQKIRDTEEIQDLILLCRSHLRGDG